MKKLKVLLVLLLPFIFPGCSKCNKCCDPMPSNPGSLFLSIKQNGQPYSDSLMNDVKMYYFNNGKKIMNPNDDPTRPSTIMYDDTVLLQRVYGHNDSIVNYIAPGVFGSYYAVKAIAESNIHDFYLQFPDGDIDSLNIQIEKFSEKDVNKAPCMCLNQITEITINGKPMLLDTTKYTLYGGADDNSTYLIEK